MLATIHRDTKKRRKPFSPSEFDPYAARPRGDLDDPEMGWAMLKAKFGKKRKKRKKANHEQQGNPSG